MFENTCPFDFHSTPARRHPVNGGKTSNGCHKVGGGVSGAKSSRNLSEAEAGTTDNDDLILKRMEEILMTYKSKVEDHLAAEGRELPKEIFEDFTSRWVQNQAQVRLLVKIKMCFQGNTSPSKRRVSDSCLLLFKSHV